MPDNNAGERQLFAGSCQCGQVTYTASEPPQLAIVCHCIDCQKLSASAWSPTLVFRSTAFRVAGELHYWERQTDTGRRNIAYFCPSCGNRIYHADPDRPDAIRLKGGTLDNVPIPEPQAHLWTSRKQPWVELPEHVPQFAKNMPAEFARKLLQQS